MDFVFAVFPLVFGLIFFAMIVLFVRQFGRVSRFQGRVFDALDRQLERHNSSDQAEAPPTARGYHCNQCGARLEDGGDVSPSGDFKCSYCGKWSNIHS
jgi:DNA-directed RNA polymerase subunit RPC12/RpoP